MNGTDIMVHFQENLDSSQKNEIESQLREIDGVIAPRFNKEHLLLIYYNSAKTDSSAFLSFFKSNGYQTKLVGM
jgi:hypothetical protein